MIQNWSIRSRAHQCALTERPFEDGEVFHTAIYFDTEANGYIRRDVALDAWEREVSERTPLAYWKTTYTPVVAEARPEVTSKESAMALLQRFVEEDEPQTENARYILALMLERKKILSPTATKETENGKMLFYENKKTSEVFMVRDPELRLDELVQVQDEVAALLGFGGPAAEAAKAAGMKFTPDGKLEKVEKPGKGGKKAAVGGTPAQGADGASPTQEQGDAKGDDATPPPVAEAEGNSLGENASESPPDEPSEAAETPAPGEESAATGESAADGEETPDMDGQEASAKD